MLRTLEEISKCSNTCPRIQHAPKRFRAHFGAEETYCNQGILLDIMYLGEDPVHSIMDESTSFIASFLLQSISAEHICLKLIDL